MIKICPNCQKQIVFMEHCGDYVHNCDDNPEITAVSQEDVLRIGDWEDFDGSGTIPPQEVMNQGLDDGQWGTRASLEDKHHIHPLTERGKPKSLYRTRSFYKYIESPDNL